MSNRNSEAHYSQVPHANVQRAQFDRTFDLKTTFNEGQLIPLYVDEVLPGDTVKIRLNSLVRMMTPLYPVMDNAYIDYYAFFVPNRLLWEHWQNLMGENTSTYWAEKTEYTTPKTTAPSNGWNVGTIADYMGIPTGVSGLKVNSMPFRAYARIWNEWFRDENLQQPVVQDMDDATNAGSNTGTNLTDAENGGLPLTVAKYHDYFTSCLPAPQKGDAIEIQLGSTIPKQYSAVLSVSSNTYSSVDLGRKMNYANNGSATGYGGADKVGTNISDVLAGIVPTVNTNVNSVTSLDSEWSSNTSRIQDYVEIPAINASGTITINELRQSIALQHILEADARGGTRYVEILKNEFGVTSPDSRLQRSEYIGGYRSPINISQVIQNSSTDSTSPQGNTAAYSLTTGSRDILTYSAVEHGYIMVLSAVRVDHSYQQGLARMWTRSDRFSYYHPMLANLGEQAVLNQEIYAQGTDTDEEVFGYQEAWADYRYHPNQITGMMRSQYAQSLDAWHYADDYESLPTLSSKWIQEGTSNIARTLAVEDTSLTHQFIANFAFDMTWTRPMPIYSIPGLDTI